MGGAETAFQEKRISGAELLALVMRRSLKTMTPGFSVSESGFNGWVADARAIKGDPLELAAAIEWAITKSDYWTGYLDSMGKFAAKVDVILGQYRGAARSAKIGAGDDEPPSLQKLRTLYGPDTPRQSIIHPEWQRRMALLKKKVNKECKRCDENGFVPSPSGFRDEKGNLCQVPCPDCSKKMEPFSRKIFNQVRAEVYGKVTSA